MLSMKDTIVLSLASLLGVADAFWRVGCGTIQTGRIDPLVSPGTLSGHCHKISGASNFGFNSNYSELFSSACTTCEISADKSAYWTPTFYYKHGNGTFQEVQNGGHLIYYLGRAQNGKIKPFPKGFGMVSGIPKARYYDNTTLTAPISAGGRPLADRVSFACLTTPDKQKPEQPAMFYTDCQYGLRAQLHFQSCWDGVNLYKTDNSHVAYLTNIDTGTCPSTHPVNIPHLFYELYYFTNLIQQTPGGQFVWSTGDTTGYGFHGDFINGWDPVVLANATANCLSNVGSFGVIDDCPILKQYHNPQTDWNCPEREPLVNETYHGLLDKIPGCITITSGPANAQTAELSCPPAYDARIGRGSLPLPPEGMPLSYVQPPTPTEPVKGQLFGNNGWAYDGCANDTYAGKRALTGPSTVTSNMTVNYCQTFCGNRGYPLAGLEYGKECYCGFELQNNGTYDWRRYASLYSDVDCNMRCSKDFGQWCGGPTRLSVFRVTDESAVFTVIPSATPGPTTADAVAVATATPTLTAPGYLGCAVDGVSGRALPNSTFSNTTAMTIQTCRSFCGGKTYALAGLEYGQECWCGNALLNGGYLLPNSSSCSFGCKGNTSYACGGSFRLSLYNTSSVFDPSGTPVPAVVPAVGSYVSKGCYSEPLSGSRALAGYTLTDKKLMTVEKCISYCTTKNMPYAGLEMGTMCYCAKALSANATAAATGCGTPCVGNATEYCGGTKMLNVYQRTTSMSRTGT